MTPGNRLLSRTATIQLKVRLRAAIGHKSYSVISEESGVPIWSVRAAMRLHPGSVPSTIKLAEFYNVPIPWDEE